MARRHTRKMSVVRLGDVRIANADRPRGTDNPRLVRERGPGEESKGSNGPRCQLAHMNAREHPRIKPGIVHSEHGRFARLHMRGHLPRPLGVHSDQCRRADGDSRRV